MFVQFRANVTGRRQKVPWGSTPGARNSGDRGFMLPDAPMRDKVDREPSLPESTTNGNHDYNQPRDLHSSPKVRDASNLVMLRHRIPLTTSSGMFLTWMKERTWLLSAVMVWVGMRLCSRVGMLR